MSDEHDRYREWSAAYVLGALEPADRAEFERHLDGCARCQADVRAFAPLPGLLSTVDPGALASAAAPGDDDATARVTRVASERARAERDTLRRSLRRWRVAAVGIAAAAVLGLGALSLPSAEDPGRVLEVTAAADATAGSLSVHERGWGTHVEVDLTGLPARGRYQLMAVAADGSVQTAATWGPTPTGRARVTGATAIPVAELDRLEVISDDPADVLVRATAGG